MAKDKLVEIKKGQIGTGLLIENEGYISSEVGSNKKLFEDIHTHQNDGDFHCPYPFIVSAVLQKYGIENANGRIYPEAVLKREVDKYMTNIKEKRAIGECYRPEAMILTESGWKRLYEVSVGENVLTLNTNTNEIEIQPIKNIVSYDYDGDMINIKGRHINDIVTPDHGYPIYDNKSNFKFFMKASELFTCNMDIDCYLPFNELNDNDKLIDEVKFMKVNDCDFSKIQYTGEVMCVEVDNHVWFVMDNNRCHWTKNCNHPDESVIDLSRVAINVVECHWEGHTLIGQLEILTSPGFRKHGIISCQGDQIANLILQGIKIGVSSRGLGTVTNKLGVMYVSDDFELVCWDVVSSPSTPGSYIAVNKDDLQQYVESVETDKTKNKLFEKLEQFSDWLND